MGIQDYPSNLKENGKDWIFTAKYIYPLSIERGKGVFLDDPLTLFCFFLAKNNNYQHLE